MRNTFSQLSKFQISKSPSQIYNFVYSKIPYFYWKKFVNISTFISYMTFLLFTTIARQWKTFGSSIILQLSQKEKKRIMLKLQPYSLENDYLQGDFSQLRVDFISLSFIIYKIFQYWCSNLQHCLILLVFSSLVNFYLLTRVLYFKAEVPYDNPSQYK